MARFKMDEVDNYGGQGGGGFLRLEDDGDVARVRFCYDSPEDIEGIAVHRVKVGTRDDGNEVYRSVNCLRDYNAPLDDCPFCREKIPVKAKLYIPVYDIDNNVIKTWERGKNFFSKLSSLAGRYPAMVKRVFEIERCGKKGDKQTDYQIYPIDEDYDEKLTVADLVDEVGDLPEVIGGIVLDKTAEDMEYFLQEGKFPPTDDDADEQEEERPRRGSGRSSGKASERRTPGRTGRRGEGF